MSKHLSNTSDCEKEFSQKSIQTCGKPATRHKLAEAPVAAVKWMNMLLLFTEVCRHLFMLSIASSAFKWVWGLDFDCATAALWYFISRFAVDLLLSLVLLHNPTGAKLQLLDKWPPMWLCICSVVCYTEELSDWKVSRSHCCKANPNDLHHCLVRAAFGFHQAWFCTLRSNTFLSLRKRNFNM